MPERPMKYNPAFLSDEELVRSFVVREADLQLIVDALRDNTGESNQHVLVIAPRGMGKTTLLLRVAAEVRRDNALQTQWYPLVFAEESYEVTTPGEFWLEALFHLAHQTQDERWARSYEELRKETDEMRLRQRALAQLMDFADGQGKRILLVVENLNMLLCGQISDDDAWVLRHTLQHEPRVMMLASATSRFDEVENTGKALFEAFRPITLKPLDEAECRKVWFSITGQDPPANQIRPIQILTGGSPRLLAIFSSFAAGRSFGELMADLTQLV
ncbi:MAG: ATP-binding protein, partial [Chlorobiales bacterium]|nr:ATP-binding protein [Chlorobiales bacterium]